MTKQNNLVTLFKIANNIIIFNQPHNIISKYNATSQIAI